MVGTRAIDHLGAAAIRRLLHSLGDPPIRVILPDGRALGASAAGASASIHVRDRAALLRLVHDPDVQFGELFTDGRVEVSGDLVELLCAAYRSPLGEEGSRRRAAAAGPDRTATLRARVTRSSRSACSSTWAPRTMRSWAFGQRSDPALML